MECTFCDPTFTCPYEKSKRELLAAELGVTNTRYFLTEANHVGKLSRLPFVVLDECDVMEQELMGYIEVSVTNQMRKLLNLPAPKYKTKPESWTEWFQKVLPKVRERLDDMAPTEDDNLMQKRSYQAVKRLYDNLKRVAPEVADGGWVYCDYQNANITFKPVKVNKYGQEYLWRHADRWLCMSASIISPEEFVASLGYEGPWECVRMPSPFDPTRRPIFIAPVASMTFDEKEQEWPKMATAVAKVMDMFPDERILVHTVSYPLSNALCTDLGPRARTYLDRTERAKAIAWFEETTDGVLLAPSLDRGFDGADDLTRCVVITKLPFPNIGDQQIRKILHSPGGGTWYAVATTRSLVQMAGRGMRHEGDWCKIIILDKQFERFWKDGKRGGVHRYLPQWFVDAIIWGGEYRAELTRG